MLQQELEHAEGNLERQACEILERFVVRAKSQGVEAVQRLGFGSPWQEICRQVLVENHDLVVIGTRDLGQISRILFGSTGVKLLRYCPCPVWITRPDPNWDDLNILVPSDLSDVSQNAAPHRGQWRPTGRHATAPASRGRGHDRSPGLVRQNATENGERLPHSGTGRSHPPTA